MILQFIERSAHSKMRAFEGENFVRDVVVSLLQGAVVPAVLIYLYIQDV